MSSVTDVIVTCSIMDDDLLEKLNAELQKLEPHVSLQDVAPFAGGNKRMQGRLWAAAINYLDQEAFLAIVEKLPWTEREAVVVLMKEENESGFAVRFGSPGRKPE